MLTLIRNTAPCHWVNKSVLDLNAYLFVLCSIGEEHVSEFTTGKVLLHSHSHTVP